MRIIDTLITPKECMEFLTTKNTIEIKCKEDFEVFIMILRQYEMLEEVLSSKKARSYDYWKNLVMINSKGKYDLVFEYDINKGLTFYTDRQISIDWYGKEPITLGKLNDEDGMYCHFCLYNCMPQILSKIEGRDKSIFVCPNCLGEYIEEILIIEPLKHTCDCCDSQISYKVTTSFKTYYLCKEHFIDFFCYNLDKQAFKKLYQREPNGNCDFYLHDDFYDDDGMPLQPNDELAKELKDTLLCDEWCPNCENEVQIRIDKPSLCPICHTMIKPCSMCNMNNVDCNHCKYD